MKIKEVMEEIDRLDDVIYYGMKVLSLYDEIEVDSKDFNVKQIVNTISDSLKTVEYRLNILHKAIDEVDINL